MAFNFTHYENLALNKASDDAGAYLERINKTDLATLSEEEWQEFIQTVFLSATGELQRLAETQAVPF